MKRILTLVMVLILFVPVFSFADTIEETADSSVIMTVPDDWDFEEIDSEDGFDENYQNYSLLEVTGENAVLSMDCLVEDNRYLEEKTSYSYEEMKKIYLDTGKPLVRQYLDEWMEVEGFQLSVCGRLEGCDTEYVKIKATFEDEPEQNMYIYFAESFEGLYEILALQSLDDSDIGLQDADIKAAEKMIRSMEFDGPDSEFFYWDEEELDEYDDEYDDEYEEDYTDSEDGIGLIFAILAIVMAIRTFVSSSSEKEDEEIGTQSFDDDIVSKMKKTTKNEKEVPEDTSLEKDQADEEDLCEDVIYQSSVSYERSLKDLLDSGLITKKEYRELLKKHGK